jgi:hypothetical protein
MKGKLHVRCNQTPRNMALIYKLSLTQGLFTQSVESGGSLACLENPAIIS